MRKALLWIIAVMTLANGAFMVLAAEHWWAAMPGVDEISGAVIAPGKLAHA